MANKFNIPLEQAKDQALIEHSEDDTLLEGLLESSVETILNRIGLGGVLGLKRSFRMSSQTARIGHPVATVDTVKKQDCSSGTCALLDVDAADYELTAVDDLFKCLSFTDEGFENLNGAIVNVEYTIALSEIPAPLVQAALMLMTHFYENRSAVVVGQGVSAIDLPIGVETLIAPYRSIFFV